MNKNLSIRTLIILFTIGMMSACHEEETITNLDLLTDGSSKTWRLVKVGLTANGITNTFTLQPCQADDEYTFYTDKQLLLDNKGTTLSDSDFEPSSCKDTLTVMTRATWALNTKMDTLTTSYANNKLQNKVIRISSDSMVLGLTFHNIIELQYFVAKK